MKPSRANVEAVVQKIPRGKVITMRFLRESLAASHHVEVTCPFLTKRALIAIASDAKTQAPFWRVVRDNGEMLGYYPGGETAQARRLRNERLMITAKLGKLRVMHLSDARWV